jgi:hypothetical protein
LSNYRAPRMRPPIAELRGGWVLRAGAIMSRVRRESGSWPRVRGRFPAFVTHDNTMCTLSRLAGAFPSKGHFERRNVVTRLRGVRATTRADPPAHVCVGSSGQSIRALRARGIYVPVVDTHRNRKISPCSHAMSSLNSVGGRKSAARGAIHRQNTKRGRLAAAYGISEPPALESNIGPVIATTIEEATFRRSNAGFGLLS